MVFSQMFGGGGDMNEKERRAQRGFERNERLLPWGLSERVAITLAVVKVPLVILCTVIALYAELRVKQLTDQTWLRGGSTIAGATSCYAHNISDNIGSTGLGDFSLLETLNRTLLHGALNHDAVYQNITFDPMDAVGQNDYCGIKVSNLKHAESGKAICSVDLAQPQYSMFKGIDHMLPFSLLWFIYKMVFIGVHPVDRLFALMGGDATEPSEPIAKLLTEPYFQRCTLLMMIVAKIFHYIRYRLMANVLLAALVSMQEHPQCHNFIVYKMDWFWGTACYYMIVLDLIVTAVAYALSKTVMNGRLIGTCMYRVYKIYWYLTCLLSNTFAIWGLWYTFGGLSAIFQALRATIRIVIHLDFALRLNLDILRIFVFVVIILEAVELQLFIMTVICPLCLGWLPCCKFLRDNDNDEHDSESVHPLVHAPSSGKSLLKVALTPEPKHHKGLKGLMPGLPFGKK